MNNKVKEVRQAKSMSQSELARRANVSRPTIIKIENCRDVEVKVSTLNRIADALEMPASEIFLL